MLLRAAEPRDLPAIDAGIHDPDVIRWIAPPEGSAQAVLVQNEERWARGSPTLSICELDGTCVGKVWMNIRETDASTGFVGYWLLPVGRGRGLATSAVRLLSTWAMRELGLTNVRLTTAPDNERSQRVAERSGFRRVSSTADQVVYALDGSSSRDAESWVRLPRLDSPRLVLRVLPPRAAATLVTDRAEAEAAIGSALDPAWPLPDLLDILPAHATALDDDLPFGVWLIVERASDTVVGDIGFHGPPDPEGTVEIGYSIVPSRRNRGYATEAAQTLISWARRHPRVRCIVAGSAAANAASIRTLERLGFTRDGERDGELRWTLADTTSETT